MLRSCRQHSRPARSSGPTSSMTASTSSAKKWSCTAAGGALQRVATTCQHRQHHNREHGCMAACSMRAGTVAGQQR
jgi:hypothetical protein